MIIFAWLATSYESAIKGSFLVTSFKPLLSVSSREGLSSGGFLLILSI